MKLQKEIGFQMGRMSGKEIKWPSAPSTAPYPDLTVKEPVIDILIETFLWVHIDAVSFQVLLDLGD